jgi:hypothetical protein
MESSPADPHGGPPYLSVCFQTEEKSASFSIGYRDAMHLACLLMAHAWPLSIEDGEKGDEDTHYTIRNARQALEQFFLDRGDARSARRARDVRSWAVHEEDEHGQKFILHKDDHPDKGIECTVQFPHYHHICWGVPDGPAFVQNVDAVVTLADGQSGTVTIMLN